MDHVFAAWAREGNTPPPLYAAGSWGPEQADDLLARDGRRWRRP
jgi:glucose-6-phosphate 1-dehydrogenase